MTMKIKIILGTTRKGRFGDKPAQWILDEASALPDPHALRVNKETAGCLSVYQRAGLADAL